MKTFCLVFFFIPFFLYGQQAVWTPPVIIEDITVNAADKIISYSDADGNHLVINSSGTITYYRLNIEGGFETSVPIDNGCEYSNYTVAITAYQDELYIIYQKGTKIKVSKSIDAGNSWNFLTEKDMGNNICNGIDAVYDELGLHVVWAVGPDLTSSSFQTYYERYRRQIPQQWVEFKHITDEGYTGGRPSIALSENRIHLNYNIYSGYELSGPYYYNLGYINSSRTRDFNFTNNEWEPSQSVTISAPTLLFPCELDFWSGSAEKIIVYDGYLHVISFVWTFPIPETCTLAELFIYNKRRPVYSNIWDSEVEITKGAGGDENIPAIASIDQKLNIVSTTGSHRGMFHFQYSNDEWSDGNDIVVFQSSDIRDFCLSAYSQSLFAFWISLNNELFFSQSSQNPSVPLKVNPLLNKQHDFFDYEAEILSEIVRKDPQWRKLGSKKQF